MPKINRLQSFRYAFEGLWHTLRTQRNAQIHAGIGVIVIGLGLFLGLSLTEWAIITLTVGFVMAAETFNTALEATMDHVTSDIHPQVKIVKDVAAGAVLLSAITALIVGLPSARHFIKSSSLGSRSNMGHEQTVGMGSSGKV